MYAASVNPPRRAKLQAATSLLPTLLPSPPSTSTISTSSSFSVSNITQSSETTTTTMQPKKKRGRKPASGASSRAAREAARKANHSRIEKARRGKINDALQELKRLVPPDFAASVREGEGGEDEDEDEGDEDDEVDSPVSPTGRGLSKRESGKKSNAEREFKLDILERTVLFVRALLKRVEENERSAVSKASRHTRTSDCSCQRHTRPKGGHTRKRKVDEREYKEQAKKRRTATALTYEEQNDTPNVDEDDEETNSSTNSEDSNDAAERSKISTSPLSLPSVPKNNVRLPSISELLSSPVDIGSTHAPAHQLPSPSLSPHFSPHFRSSEDRKARFAPSLSPPAPSPQLSVPRRRTTSAERRDWSCEARDVALALDSRLSCPCPVGMSYLLTPPSADPSAMAHQGLQAPVFRLPSSAFAVRDTLGVGVGVGEVKTTSGIEVGIEDGDEDEGEDENDTEARAATLALLQMRGAGYSRSGGGGGVGVGAKTRDVTRTSLTPGGLLGIRTG